MVCLSVLIIMSLLLVAMQTNVKRFGDHATLVVYFHILKRTSIQSHSFTSFQGFGSVSGSGSAWIRINLSCWIRIRIQEGQNDPKKWKKGQNFHLLKCWMFSFEG
jgi:hypothetical protein